MKHAILNLVLLICVRTIASALPGTTIKGSWERRSDGVVKLYRVDHGRLEELSSFRLGADKTFGFFFRPSYEGIYVIGTGNAMAQPDKYNFYFKGGETLNVSVNDSSYTLPGINTPENKELARWHDFGYSVEKKSIYFNKSSSTYKDFFPDFETFLVNVERYKAVKTGNKKFDTFFPVIRQYDLYNIATTFLSTPRTAHPETGQLIGYYKTLHTGPVTQNTVALNIPFGLRILNNMSRIESRYKEGAMPSIDDRIAAFSNDTLKGEVVLEEALRLKTYIGYQDLNKKFGNYILTADQQSRAKEIVTKLAVEANKPGQKAVNFTYPDLDGKNVSLTDFKGKVVLVDVWATWCGPCKAEIPSLKKMEEEMRDKNIVFMSVSVDEQKDHQKWKDFVAAEGLKGIQLFAAGWSDIAKFYDIKGIPRFMVFDKNGDIVTINAPRPSSPELKLLLESKL